MAATRNRGQHVPATLPDRAVDGPGSPACSPRESLALLGWPSADGHYGFVSTALTANVSIAPLANSGAFELVLHWPFFAPEVYLAPYPAP
jgi:hypothetical protein